MADRNRPMDARQKDKAREIFRAMSDPVAPAPEPRRPEDDVIEALEADADAHEAASVECRRAARLLRERQRLGDVRRALKGGADK